MKKPFAALLLAVTALPCFAWGPQGHRLVAAVAMDHLTPLARRNVDALLGPETLTDVASWPDAYRPLETQTAPWHYVSVPAEAATYDRDRDCPPQPGTTLGASNDKWRDCVVDRILFFESRVADPKLDDPDRAVSLKYLVHFVGDLHQPFHAYGPERGGNTIAVVQFGSPTCGHGNCNLHATWDSGLLTHRQLDDKAYLAFLEHDIQSTKRLAGDEDPATWAAESHAAALTAALPNNGAVDEAYFTREIPVADQRLELAGLRLAAVLNRLFTTAPTRFVPPPAEPLHP